MDEVRDDEFPAPSRQASGIVNGIETQVTSLGFSDKIVITISQEGRLAQWIQVPLISPPDGLVELPLPSTGQGVLPLTHLTATTLLGSGGDDRETLGHLYAGQIASHVSLVAPDDRRTLILGLGLSNSKAERTEFFDLIDLVKKVV
ncbi:hypothetical protein E4U17_003880 [Claviceps sp. LM77 group G4]|nr:hypothetical protein E4U17_003880 [Claviceps sp. LM77 group G4]KAG6080736.1 hypothetical protein E4U33_007358 [Claviceps sp. LM78 group G4]